MRKWTVPIDVVEQVENARPHPEEYERNRDEDELVVDGRPHGSSLLGLLLMSRDISDSNAVHPKIYIYYFVCWSFQIGEGWEREGNGGGILCCGIGISGN